MDIPLAPQDERKSLACIMKGDKSTHARARALLSADMYEDHALVARTVFGVLAAGGVPDPATIRDRCKSEAAVVQVASADVTPDNLSLHAEGVREAYLRRRYMAEAGTIIDYAQEPGRTIKEVRAHADTELLGLSASMDESRAQRAGEDVMDAMDAIVADAGVRITGWCETTLPPLDTHIRGFHPRLTIVAARTSHGKTAFTLQQILHAARQRVEGAILTLEMTAQEMRKRLLHTMARVQSGPTRDLTDSEITDLRRAAEELKDLPLWIVGAGGMDIYDVEACIRRLRHEHDVQLYAIDYHQNLTPAQDLKDLQRYERAKVEAARLLSLCKKEDVGIWLASQLTRGASARKPRPSDLRGGGEDDCDTLIMLWRPERDDIEMYDDGSSTEGRASIMISKNRHGDTGAFRCHFDGATGRFLTEAQMGPDDDGRDRPAAPVPENEPAPF